MPGGRQRGGAHRGAIDGTGYEIYKVGVDPFWAEGMDILGQLGLPLVVVPHWNNAEGGTFDTRFCFMGEPGSASSKPCCPMTSAFWGSTSTRRASWIFATTRPGPRHRNGDAPKAGIGDVVQERGSVSASDPPGGGPHGLRGEPEARRDSLFRESRRDPRA